MGCSVTIRCKSWEKNPNFGVKSEIQRAKFRVFVTYKFGGNGAPTKISEANFGAKPPSSDLLPGLMRAFSHSLLKNKDISILR